jgi:hypothetical protein
MMAHYNAKIAELVMDTADDSTDALEKDRIHSQFHGK